MSTVTVRLLGRGQCVVVHTRSGVQLQTDAPPEYGGRGQSFSATDLLAAALGSCIATSIDRIAERHGLPLQAIAIRIDKELAVNPKRVTRLTVTVLVPTATPSEVLDRLRHAAATCPVHRSLNPDITIALRFQAGRSEE